MGKKFDKTKKMSKDSNQITKQDVVVDPSYKIVIPASKFGKIKIVKDALMLKGPESYLAKLAYTMRDGADKRYSLKDWVNGKSDQQLVSMLSEANAEIFDSIFSIVTDLMSSVNKVDKETNAEESLTHQGNSLSDSISNPSPSIFDILR